MIGTHKYGRIFRSTLILTLLLLCPNITFAQDGQPPDVPDIIRVTVDHSDNGVLIQWEPSTDLDIKYYNVYREVDRAWVFIVGMPPNVFEHKHTTSGLRNLKYSVQAEDSSTNRSWTDQNFHKAVTVSVEFDPCTPANNITWTPYVGWENEISGYILYGGTDPVNLELLETFTPAELSASHKQVDINETYYYYIETLHLSGISSNSAIDSISTIYPEAPLFLEVDYVSVIDQSTVEIQFTADITGPVNDFRLMRRSNDQAPYSEVITIPNAGHEIQVVQDQVQTSIASYEYVTQAVFQPAECNSPLVISQSLSRPNILLQGSYENQMTTLTWAPYAGSMADISGYTVQRKKDENDFITVVSSLSPGTSLWREPIESVVNGHQLGKIQYRILAEGITIGYGNPGPSVSNVVDIHIETDMQIPNAFTPESGDINSQFKPVLDFAPRKFVMVIYDRAGRKLYESTDPGEGWNGRFGDGNFVDEGVYVYYIQYTDYTGLFRSFTGNVTVLYP